MQRVFCFRLMAFQRATDWGIFIVTAKLLVQLHTTHCCTNCFVLLYQFYSCKTKYYLGKYVVKWYIGKNLFSIVGKNVSQNRFVPSCVHSWYIPHFSDLPFIKILMLKLNNKSKIVSNWKSMYTYSAHSKKLTYINSNVG